MPVTTCTKCFTIIPLGQSRCSKHPAKTKPKASRQSRGYGADHQALRAQWIPVVKTGTIKCARCKTLIKPSAKWDLGHHDQDRSRYTGPEHYQCNRGRRTR